MNYDSFTYLLCIPQTPFSNLSSSATPVLSFLPLLFLRLRSQTIIISRLCSACCEATQHFLLSSAIFVLILNKCDSVQGAIAFAAFVSAFQAPFVPTSFSRVFLFLINKTSCLSAFVRQDWPCLLAAFCSPLRPYISLDRSLHLHSLSPLSISSCSRSPSRLNGVEGGHTLALEERVVRGKCRCRIGCRFQHDELASRKSTISC